MQLTRRHFAKRAGLLLGAARALSAAPKARLCVQLYSVRGLAKLNLSAALRHIAEIGYEGVEFAGYYGHSAREVSQVLKDTGLKVVGAHVDWNSLLDETLAQTVDFNRAIGNRSLIVPAVPQQYRQTIAGWRDAGKRFGEIAAKLKADNFLLGYHNHAREFEQIDGELPFDAFFSSAGTAVKVELDIGHALQGGANPVDILKRYRGRIYAVHVKDFSPALGIVEFGEGAVPWPDVFRAIRADRAIQWKISEEEAKACVDYACIEHSYARIQKLWQLGS